MSEYPEISISQASQLFLRLPVKSLLRFRCLSKPLCAEIDSPKFIKQFLDHSLKTRPNFDIIISKGPLLYSLRFPHDNDLTTAEAIELHCPFKDPNSEVVVVGSCNGILCLQKMGMHLTLWNRATGQYRKVEPPNYLVSRNSSTYFGYDQSKDDYKVVIISVAGQESYAIDVYSLKTDSWTKINQEFPYRNCWLDSGVFIHGSVHWLASEKPFQRLLEPELIVAFDVGTETFRQIPKPNRSGHYCLMMGLYDLGGHLCLVSNEIKDGFRNYMWVMENYGAKEWTPLSLPVKAEIPGFRPFAYYPQGSKQVLGMLGCKLQWCFPEQSRLVKVSVHGFPVYQNNDLSESDSDVSDSDDDQPYSDGMTFMGCTCFESLVPVQREQNLEGGMNGNRASA